MALEVIGRILPLLHGVVYYEDWTPFPIMGTIQSYYYCGSSSMTLLEILYGQIPPSVGTRLIASVDLSLFKHVTLFDESWTR